MKLIIDIPEYELGQIAEHVSSGIYDYNGLTATAFKSIANGTSFDSVIEESKNDFWLQGYRQCFYDIFGVIDNHKGKRG